MLSTAEGTWLSPRVITAPRPATWITLSMALVKVTAMVLVLEIDGDLLVEDVAGQIVHAGHERQRGHVGPNRNLNLAGKERAAGVEEGGVDLAEGGQSHGHRALDTGRQVDDGVRLRRQRRPGGGIVTGQAQQQGGGGRLEEGEVGDRPAGA